MVTTNDAVIDEDRTAVPGTFTVGEAIEDRTGDAQLPHRHQSVAVDLIVGCAPGCYTLLGDRIDPGTRQIVDPIGVDWQAGGAFVTPPGKWHSHHNESGSDAHLVPIQDAGLQTYLRALDIRFT